MNTEQYLENISIKTQEIMENSGIETDYIDFAKLVDKKVGALQKPKINISINSAKYRKITLTTQNCKIVLSLFLLVQELRNEKARRFANYKLINEIDNVLYLEKLGLKLQDPLIPLGFNNVTDQQFADAGYAIYQLNYSCSFNVTNGVEKDLGALISIVNKYYLQPDDGVADTEGLVDLATIYGGNAVTMFILPVIYGGKAGTEFKEPEIYGGKAGSTY